MALWRMEKHHAGLEFPIYNFSTKQIPENLIRFMKKYSPNCHIYGRAPDAIKLLAETDNLGSEIDAVLLKNQADLHDEQKFFQNIRRKKHMPS